MIHAENKESVQNMETMDISAQETSQNPPEAVGDVYLFPASLEQHRYWILDQVDQASTASNMAIAWRVFGKLNDSLVEQSICALTLRHEALRTTFQMIDGELNQVISEQPLYDFSVTDLSAFPEEERQDRADKVMREHSHAPMNLATGPLFFARLIHVSEDEHYLACTMHHIVCDGWSNGILVRDFAELYSAYSQNRSPNLAELPFQFADFTLWQREWLASEAAEDALRFWREQIQRGTPAVDLPTDHPRGAHKDGPGDIESQLLPQSIHERLKLFCREHQATTHQVLLAAFQGLISRYTSQEQFLLGSSIANRTQPGMDNVVGRFANPQVILADAAGNPSFRELLDRVIEWSTLAYAYQDLPFSRLMEEFQLDQSGATSQFLQIYFVYQKAFMQPQEATGLRVVPRPSVSGGVNFDLLVSIVERAEGPRLQIEYNTDLFRKDRIRKFIDQYIRILGAVLENDSLRLSELPLLSREDEQASQKTGAPLQDEVAPSLIACFDRQAAELGTSAAIISGTERISWQSLKEKSLAFANVLAKHQVEPGSIVAIRMEPTADAAAAGLAALRLGAAVLPVPASTSVNEWQAILAQQKPVLSLAGEELSGKIPSAVSFSQLNQPAEPSSAFTEITGPTPAWLNLSLDASGKYCVSATTHEWGSTNFAATAQALNLQQGDVVAVKTSETIPDAWTDIFMPLTQGATILHLDHAPVNELQTLFDREQVSFVLATINDGLDWLHSGWNGDRRLQFICRGSRISSALTNKLQPHVGRMFSLVSASPAGGVISVSALKKSAEGEWPIEPLPGQRFSILDTWGNPTPEGVFGELCIARGEETLRTGLLAQHAIGNGFEIVDHVRHLVRLHGYRLRLGELEDRLLASPGVARAKTSIQDLPDGSPRLVAYISGYKDKPPVVEEVSRFLRATAPGHLSSAELFSVDSIPLRPDGSPEVTALPRPGTTQSTLLKAEDYVPPRDEIESKLVKIWEDVLGVKGIGVRSSFFALGGYSLMIVRLFARINKAMNTSLPITTIFNAPTIEELADILRGSKAFSSLVPVRTQGDKPPFFMILSYLLYGSLPDSLGKDYPFYGLRELHDDERLTPKERAASYVKEIRAVQPQGPYYLGGWCAAGPITIEVGRQLMESGQEVGLVVLFDSWCPGYAEKLRAEQRNSNRLSLSARLSRRYKFHRQKIRNQPLSSQVQYIGAVARNKFRSMRNHLYLRHWSLTTRVFKRFGIPLPDFMHNVTQTTLVTLQQYTPEPFEGNLMLLRAINEPTLPGADATCGWNEVVKGDIEVSWAPGDHETMFLEPNLTLVGKTVREALQRAQAAV